MGSKRSFYLFPFFLVSCLASSSHISNEVLEVRGSIGRALLQQKTTCPLDIEHMNFTVITSQCKGPRYTAEKCCPPLKVLMCPDGVREKFNDLKSNCGATLYGYANLFGKYPPGLFSSLCKEGAQGLDCTGFDSNATTTGSPNTRSTGFRTASSSLPVTLSVVMIFIFHVVFISY